MNRVPLRLKITLWSALVVFAALGVFGGLVIFQYERQQSETLDDELADEGRQVLAAYQEGLMSSSTKLLDTILPIEGNEHQVDLLRKDGTVLFRSPKLGENSLVTKLQSRRPCTVTVNGMRIRARLLYGEHVRLAIGTTLEEIDAQIDKLIVAYLLALPCAALVAGLGGWWIARQALSPIDVITQTAAGIHARALDQRLSVPLTGDEIERLSRVLNNLLERLEKAFIANSRFTSEASHELRTPLTIMRGEIEAALQSGRCAAPEEKRLIDLLEEVQRLTQIVESLLLLSKADSGRLDLTLEPFDFSTLLEELVEDAVILAVPARVEIRADIPAGQMLLGDRRRLRQVFLNLMDNAIKYNSAGGYVALTLVRDEGAVVVTLRNTGPAISDEDRQRVFDRFFRSSQARSEGGQGLGLSICRELLFAHGGAISLSSHPEDGTNEFVVTLPLHASASAVSAARPASRLQEAVA